VEAGMTERVTVGGVAPRLMATFSEPPTGAAGRRPRLHGRGRSFRLKPFLISLNAHPSRAPMYCRASPCTGVYGGARRGFAASAAGSL
jgi:hypothetical protein